LRPKFQFQPIGDQQRASRERQRQFRQRNAEFRRRARPGAEVLHRQIDLAQLNQAIQQFDAAEGRYPKDLQELVPNYLAKILQVPPGYRITYDASTGRVKVVQK